MPNEIPILTAFKGHEPYVRDMIVDTVIQRSSVLNVLPIIPVPTGFTMKELESVTGQLGNPAFRALNEDFSNGYNEFRERDYGVKQLGDAVRVEKKVEARLPGTLLRQLRLMLKGIGMFVDYNFINGDSVTNPKAFDGLATILGTTSGATYVDNGASLTVNTSATTFESFLKLLDSAMRNINGQANAIFCSDVFYDAITSGARQMGANVLGTSTDFLGQQVTSYRGVPFLKMGNDNTGTAILPHTETTGGGSAQTSIYVCKMDLDEGLAGLSTGGIRILPDEDNLFHRDVIDFDFGLRVPTNTCVRVGRLKVA